MLLVLTKMGIESLDGNAKVQCRSCGIVPVLPMQITCSPACESVRRKTQIAETIKWGWRGRGRLRTNLVWSEITAPKTNKKRGK